MALTLYTERHSWVHRLNPMTKLVFAVTVVIAAFAISSPWWSAALLVFLVFPLIVAARIAARLARLLLVLFLPLLIIIFAVQGLFFPGAGTTLIQWGPINVKGGGLLFAAMTALRVLVLISVFMLLLLTTHPGRLMTSLVQRGMAPNISYVISATLQLIPTFQERAQNILQAQRARGMESQGSLRRRLRSLLPLTGPLILSSLTDVDERSMAMEARAFGVPGRRSSLIHIRDTTAERIVRWLLWAFAAGSLVVSALGIL